MTIAEIYGKLSPYERMEDLLTSDVFSTFRYLDVNNGLIPFLQKGINFIDQTQPDFLEEIEAADYVFWPRTTHLNREPDVLIILTKKDGNTISVLIEAKYMSGKSNISRENENAEKLDHLEGDQLAELYKELKAGNIHIDNRMIRDKYRKSEGNRYLFYVTAHYVYPKKDIDETFKVLKNNHYNQQDFYWVNWMSILDVIEEINARADWSTYPSIRLLLTDLKDLLCKKGLVSFNGVSNLKLKYIDYQSFFWSNKVELFTGLNTATINRKNQKYFWMGD